MCVYNTTIHILWYDTCELVSHFCAENPFSFLLPVVLREPGDLPTSVSQVLGFQTGTTIPSTALKILQNFPLVFM